MAVVIMNHSNRTKGIRCTGAITLILQSDCQAVPIGQIFAKENEWYGEAPYLLVATHHHTNENPLSDGEKNKSQIIPTYFFTVTYFFTATK